MSDDPQLAGTWIIDPSHSRVGFSTRHAMVTRVTGAFTDVTGQAVLDPEDWGASTVNVTVQVSSVDTRNADRDRHLLSEDFFDVVNHPEITFVSTGVDEVGENSFIVTGDLTIRGITKSVAIPLELLGVDKDPTGAVRAGLEGSRRIDRRDWDVRWNTPLDSGGVLVSDRITLEFELSLIKS